MTVPQIRESTVLLKFCFHFIIFLNFIILLLYCHCSQKSIKSIALGWTASQVCEQMWMSMWVADGRRSNDGK